MARNSDDRSLFLKMLAEHPYIYYAAKKAGISPATIYRWMKSNPAFKEEVNRLKREGLANQNESIEMVLVKKAREGIMAAIKFYLTHNSKKYRPMRPDFPPPPISDEMRKLLRRFHADVERHKPLPQGMWDKMVLNFVQLGVFDESGNIKAMWADQFGHFEKFLGPEIRRIKGSKH
jgi:hypothetical protein